MNTNFSCLRRYVNRNFLFWLEYLMWKLASCLPSFFCQWITTWIMPFGSSFFISIRGGIYRRLCKSVKGNIHIGPYVVIKNPESLVLGKSVSIHEFCFISATGGVTIGDYVSIGHRTSIISTNHKFDNPKIPIKKQGTKREEVIVGRNVWFGCGVTVLAGTKVGDNCILGAGSVLTKECPSGSICAGVPAKVIGTVPRK